MRRPAMWLALLALASATGCHSCTEEAPPAPPSASAAVLPPVPTYVRTDLKTTSADLATSNLEGQLAEAKKQVIAKPNDVAAKAMLVGLLLAHARVVGSPTELAEAKQIADDALAADPKGIDARLLHVRGLAAVHRFPEALAELDALETDSKTALLGGQTRMVRESLFAAVGRYDDALLLVREQVKIDPSSANLHALAHLLALMGKIDEAESTFVQAEEKFRDTSPFPLAELYFDRASMWEREGDLVKATSVYRAAQERVPRHVHVLTHLAQLVAPADAVSLLEPVASSGDPEVAGALGFFRDFVKDGSGKSDLARARKGYDELMTTLPEAYADHAGWFWLNVGGDPAKALVAAKKNLEARSNAEAYELGIAAALAANDRETTCALAERAKTFAYPTRRLSEQIRLSGDCSR